MRIPFKTLQEELTRVLLKYRYSAERATLSARLFAETDRDGVYSHGLNRFPRLIQYIQKGYVQPGATPEVKLRLNSFESWDGQQGPGNLNAYQAMARAIALAKAQGVGAVAVRNTNHWLRGGTYGWQAADAGCIGICFTNTMANMPPWGGIIPALGNNPFIMAMPRANGQHVVLDMAMSQFSYGKLQTYAELGKELPVPGGYSVAGHLTKNATEIQASERALPIGFWKGAGLSLLLDLVAAALSGGRTTADIAALPDEYGVSQVFMAFDVSQIGSPAFLENMVQQAIAYLKASGRENPENEIVYPGERVWQTRAENLRLGIPVDEKIWEQVLAM
jgi:3-dehydro-L-gulonate 2-dehydrogenase